MVEALLHEPSRRFCWSLAGYLLTFDRTYQDKNRFPEQEVPQEGKQRQAVSARRYCRLCTISG